LFFPRSQQHYRYEGGKGSEYYWLHFSGSRIPALFESYRLKEGVINIGSSCGDIERLIKMMMRAFSEKYKYADDFCEGILASLLSYIAAPPIISSPYGKAIKILGDLSDGSSVEEIASVYNMSPNHFIRSFKQYVGLSPNAFRIEKRMEMACEMLISTDMTVERVASAVGYADPLYFSRAFRKRTGHSPSEFRKVKRSLFQDPNSSL
jgi:AraC-like DNA-binding protein